MSAARPRFAESRLRELIDRFQRRRVAVLADLVADQFVFGDIARVSREAPVLILEHRRTSVVPGGGGNAVANLRGLGACPLPVGLVGRDPSGKRLIAALRAEGISTAGVITDTAWETPTKSRVLAGGVHTRRQQIVRIDLGARHGELEGRLRQALRTRLRTALRQAEGLLVADYGYGAASPDLCPAPRSGKRAMTVTVDSRTRIDRYRRVAACTPNQEEVERILGLPPLRTDAEVDSAGRKLLRRTGNGAVLVTRGARGMSLLERGRPALHLPAYGSDEVADVTGAGDTVTSTFTLALIAGATYAEAAILANCAAGLVVMKFGTATVSPDELRTAVGEYRP